MDTSSSYNLIRALKNTKNSSSKTGAALFLIEARSVLVSI
jgi:hypothetical protein